jgi:hypothetical protein
MLNSWHGRQSQNTMRAFEDQLLIFVRNAAALHQLQVFLPDRIML